MSGDINDCARRDAQVAIFEKVRIFFPGVNFDLTGDINRPAPAATAQLSPNDLVDQHLLPVDLYQLISRLRVFLGIGCRVRP